MKMTFLGLRTVQRVLAGKVFCQNSKLYFQQSATKTTTSRLDLTGVYPPITTPFDEDENISFRKLEENIGKWNKQPLRGYVLQGSNGEFPFLTPEERVEVVRFCKKHIPNNKMLIAGSGCESTRGTIEMTRKMADAGADACLVVTPSFYKGSMSNDALYHHYIKVAEQSSVAIILYSVPTNTGIDLPADVAVRLASHPNIIGMKESGGDVTKIGYIIHKTKGEHFQVLAGSAGFFLPALSVGCVGGVFALANVLGGELCKLQDLASDSNKQMEARELQHRLIGPNTAVTRKFGIPGVKQAMDWFGLHGGKVRSPLRPLSQENIQMLKKDFTDSGFL